MTTTTIDLQQILPYSELLQVPILGVVVLCWWWRW